MNKKQFEIIIKDALEKGAEEVEIYYEKGKQNQYRFLDSKLDSIDSNKKIGIGIRIIKNGDSHYISTNNVTMRNIEKLMTKVLGEEKQKKKMTFYLNKLIDKSISPKIPHNEFPIDKKKDIMKKIDKVARKTSKYVTQVSVSIEENNKEIEIATSTGKYMKTNKFLTRLYTIVYTENKDIKENEMLSHGAFKGYEFLDNFDLEKAVIDTTKVAEKKLSSINIRGGELPVIIGNGFGAVIFHEACGHGLEATSVATETSVFSHDLNKKVASEKVTLVDEGNMAGEWGSSIIDDEGNKTQKNVLIEKGILKEFLVDSYHAKKMNSKINGCGRRQDYHFPPTSRMSNTYLLPGKDKVNDMIKSIDYGVYCEKMSGGSVNPATGDFNFAVSTARLIENGKLTNYLKEITLIGNSKEILNNVEMVADDLYLETGYCGSVSGEIPVTIGQPTIKVSKILVGGK